MLFVGSMQFVKICKNTMLVEKRKFIFVLLRDLKIVILWGTFIIIGYVSNRNFLHRKNVIITLIHGSHCIISSTEKLT